METRIIEHLDTESREAIIEIISDEFSLIAFCFPFDNTMLSQNISLYGFMTENIMLEDSMHLPQKNEKEFFSYRLTGKVIDIHTQQVQIGDIVIKLSIPLPKDIPYGAFVSFDVMRLDLIV